MPGGRLAGPDNGNDAEGIAALVLGRLAFITRVQREVDVGHDLIGVLKLFSGNMRLAGPSFTVQVRSNATPIRYGGGGKSYERNWLKGQAVPFFVAVVDRKTGTVRLFSTWNMLNGFLAKDADAVVLIPGHDSADFREVETDLAENPNEMAIEQRIHLGRPILTLRHEDVRTEEGAERFTALLRTWIELDRENIVNRAASMYWVAGPTVYETNHAPSDAEWALRFFYNVENRARCTDNLGRAAAALRLVLDRCGVPDDTVQAQALNHVLTVFQAELDPNIMEMVTSARSPPAVHPNSGTASAP